MKKMSKFKNRYSAFRKNDFVGVHGNTLDQIRRMGPQIIIDYKLKRIAVDGLYPTTVLTWDVAGVTENNDKVMTFGDLMKSVGNWIKN
jgi:hypothetical protein